MNEILREAKLVLRLGLLIVAVAACDSADVGLQGPAPPFPTSLSVSPASAVLDAVNDQVQFTTEVRDQRGNLMPDSGVVWASTDPSVATVSSGGLAAAVAPGETTIRASRGSLIATAALMVPIGPSIVEQPRSLEVSGGEPATFSVLAEGVPAPDYQWFRDGEAIEGATQSSYTLESAQRADSASSFSVRVSNSVGDVNSTSAQLSVTGVVVYGASGMRAVVSPRDDLVGVRYRIKMVTNELGPLKLVFGASRYFTPGDPLQYITEVNVYNRSIDYTDGGCGGWPLVGSLVPGRGSIRVAAADYNFAGGRTPQIAVGVQSSDPAGWPVQTYVGDGIEGFYKSDAISQTDVAGREFEVTVLRGDTTSQVAGFERCGLPLLPQVYRRWTTTVREVGGPEVVVTFLLPDASARYLAHWEVIHFFSEFVDNPGEFTIQYWDVATRAESSPDWIDVREFRQGRYDGNGSDFGFRIVEVGGEPRLELSNVAGRSYILANTTIRF